MFMFRLFKDVTSQELWTYCLVAFGMILTYFVLNHFIDAPSGLARGQTEYTKCLELILEKGTISDAEIMCRELKK